MSTSTKTARSPLGRVNEIDLLRFIAAFAVLFHHYAFFAWIPAASPYPSLADYAKYGYLGVRLFFAISGFVILMTASRGSLKDFFVSRIVRLYPAFWACCTVTFLVTTALHDIHAVTFAQYLVNMTMFSGFVHIPSVDPAYWSLFVEMRFYLMIAVVLAVGRIRRAESFFAAWAVISIILYALPDYPVVRFLQVALITSYAAYFIAGAMFYLVWAEGPTVLRLGTVSAMWLLGLVQSARELPRLESYFLAPLSAVVVCTTITVFFLILLLVSLRRTGLFGRRNWVFVGALTYPLYLIHNEIGYALLNGAYGHVNRYVLLVALSAGALGVAYGIHALFERRLARMLKSALKATLDYSGRQLFKQPARLASEETD